MPCLPALEGTPSGGSSLPPPSRANMSTSSASSCDSSSLMASRGAPEYVPSRLDSPNRSGCGAAMPSASKDGSLRPGPALRCGFAGGALCTGASAPPTIVSMSVWKPSVRGGVMIGCTLTSPGMLATASAVPGSKLRGVQASVRSPANILCSEGDSRESVILAGEGKACKAAGRCVFETSGGIAAWPAGPIGGWKFAARNARWPGRCALASGLPVRCKCHVAHGDMAVGNG